MDRVAISELTTLRWNFEEDVLGYSRANINSIGVWRDKLADYGEEKGAELLAECGLSVSSLSWAGGFTGSDGRSYLESVEDAREAVQLAANLDAGCLIIHSGARNGHTDNHARRLYINALKELRPLAEQLDVRLAIEPMNRDYGADWTFFHSLEETLELIRMLECDQIKMALDLYHFGFETDWLIELPSFVSQIAIVQLGDGADRPIFEQNRCLLGTGVLPLETIVSQLFASGYQGPLEVELLGEDVEHLSYEKVLGHSQQFCSTLLQQAV